MRYSILALVLFGLACSKSEPVTPPTGAAPSEAPTTPSEAPAAPSEAPATPGQAAATADEGAKTAQPSITLLDAGAEPRRVLLRTFEEGAKETMKIRSQVTMIAHKGVAGDQETFIPPILHTVALEVRSVEPDGTAMVGFEVIRSEVLPAKEATASVRGKVEEAAAGIRGLKGTYRVDAQGIITAVEIAEPSEDESRDPHMADSIGEFIYRSTVPVPSEAVGRGGKWEVKRRLTEGAIVVDRTFTYELKKIRGSNMVAAVETERSAPEQKVGTPNPYDLDVFTAKGGGRLEVQLDRLAPRRATSKNETHLEMSLPSPGGFSIQQNLTVHVQERMTRP